MRVLLINSNRKADLMAAPPLGLCYVAAATQAAGHEVKVLDLCFRHNRNKELRKAIQGFLPDVIGISVRNVDNSNMLYPVSYLPEIEILVRQIKAISSATLVLGGSGATLIPGRILELLGADFIVVSDGESAFAELLKSLDRGQLVEDIPGVGMMRDGTFYLTPPSLTEFEGSNPELGKWIDMSPYERMGSAYNIQTKRGCKHRCIYCTYGVIEGTKVRLRPPVEVVDELEQALFKYQPETFEFVDSVFNDPLDHCSEILEEIARRPWKAPLTAMGVSPKGLDGRFLKLMERAGFTFFWITPESASETMISNYRKGFAIDDVIRAAEAIKGSPLRVRWSFLIGGPGETNHTLQETLDFTAKYLKPEAGSYTNTADYFLGVRIYPNTDLWAIALKEGFITEKSDPAEPLWYLSEGLDLDLAVEQIGRLAERCPALSTGCHERWLVLSPIAAFLAKLLRMPKPYWGMSIGANEVMQKVGLNRIYWRKAVAAGIKRQLVRQGYNGSLVGRGR